MIALGDPAATRGLVYDIDTFAIHDGPGTRMTVYLKGCPLSCAWCHSPESQRHAQELVLFRDRCTLCGACVRVCPQGVHTVTADAHTLDRERCILCGACVEHCPQGALAIKGYWTTAADIITQAVRLKPFLVNARGGITLSGGEPTLQPAFTATVLAGCREQGIHTAVETTAFCQWPVLKSVIDQADLVLMDIKLIDDAAHQRWTGVSNRQILQNAARLAGRNVQVRVPLIPAITDTVENIRGICRFMNDVGLKRIALLPYNPSAGAKYEWLDRPYRVEGESQSPAYLQELRDLAQRAGVEAVIVT